MTSTQVNHNSCELERAKLNASPYLYAHFPLISVSRKGLPPRQKNRPNHVKANISKTWFKGR